MRWRSDGMGYLYLGAAIVLEFLGTTFMKLSNGFGNLSYAAGTLICYGVCFYFFALSLKTVNLSIAYATWGGLGIILATAVSHFYFRESISTPGLIGIIFVVVGVVLCNFFGANH